MVAAGTAGDVTAALVAPGVDGAAPGVAAATSDAAGAAGAVPHGGVATEIGDAVQRRQGRVQRGVLAAVDIEGDDGRGAALGHHRQIMPVGRGHRRACIAALGSRRGVRLDEGHTVIDADLDRIGSVGAAIEDRIRLQRGLVEPDRPGHVVAVRPGQRTGSGQRHGGLAVETQPTADQGEVVGGPDRLGIVAEAGPILGRGAMLTEMIVEHGVGIEVAAALSPALAFLFP